MFASLRTIWRALYRRRQWEEDLDEELRLHLECRTRDLVSAVSRRTHEMGIRMSLGASRSNVLELIIGRGLRATVTGFVIGILASLASRVDPLTALRHE